MPLLYQKPNDGLSLNTQPNNIDTCFPVEGDELALDESAPTSFVTPIFIVASSPDGDFILNTFIQSDCYCSEDDKQIKIDIAFNKASDLCDKIIKKGIINLELWRKYDL